MKTIKLANLLFLCIVTLMACKKEAEKTEEITEEVIETIETETKMEKMTDPALEDKTWVLIELMGQPIEHDENKKDMSLIFMSEKGTLAGFDGCNSFNGGYELMKGNRFQTQPLAKTMKACLDMENSEQYTKAIEKADTYILQDSLLSITKGRMAAMAKFKLKSE